MTLVDDVRETIASIPRSSAEHPSCVVLVTGGRFYRDAARLRQVLDAAGSRLGLTTLIHGDAAGADALAKQWAQDRGVNQRIFRAAWDDLSHPDADIRMNRLGHKYDRKAGSRRNQQMLDEGRPDVVIAFPGGAGTRDMVRRARAGTVRIILIDWQG